METLGSKEVARSAVMISLTTNREDERVLKQELAERGIKAAAVDYGGEYISSVTKIIERTVVAAKREGIIGETHNEEGAVAGATHEAVTQLMNKAVGLNVGGKIGIARCHDHIAVSLFFGIGLLHLNEVAIGLGHRAI
jgi:hypothetical protein